MVSLAAGGPFLPMLEPSPSDRGREEGKEGDWQAGEGIGLGAEGSCLQGLLQELTA